MSFHDSIFHYTLIALIIFLIGASYYRFFVISDYIVAYEGTCDPRVHDCFIGCADDACTEEYYYSKVQKHAAELYAECGADITDCEKANLCLPEDEGQCVIQYCDPVTDGESCEILTAIPGMERPSNLEDAGSDTDRNNIPIL